MLERDDVAAVEQAWSQLVLDGRDWRLKDSFIHGMADVWRSRDEIVVTHADETHPHAAALSIAASCSGELQVASDLRAGERYATIRPSAEVIGPEPLPHPERPANVPAAMNVRRPSSVGNDWSSQLVGAREGPIPAVPVSLVIPFADRLEMLGRTLGCLSHQTYPLHLMEIVVVGVDCASELEEVIEGFRDRFGSVRYVRQEHGGFRSAAARNLGVRSAAHDFVVLLDDDMAPTPRLVELYARHLGAFPWALYCGHHRHVDADHVTIDDLRQSISPMLALHDIVTVGEAAGHGGTSHTTDWRSPIYASTGSLRFEPYPFRVVAGCNVGFTKSLFEIAGGFDEDFADHGTGDVEWGFRVWNRGFYIVPLIDACALHQDSSGARTAIEREGDQSRSRATLTDRCPVHFRPEQSRTRFSVPLVSIYIPAHNAQGTIVAAVQSALDQTVYDLEVCVVDDGSTDETLARLREHFGSEPRVRIADEENRGIGAASNSAVRMCRGVFIGQLDADDLLTPDAVELLLRPLLEDTRIGVAYGSPVKIDKDGEVIGNAWTAPHYSRFRLLHTMIVHHFRLFRARDWYRTQGFAEDIRNAVDYDMFLKMSEVTEMLHVDERVYLYRVHDSSTSRKDQAIQYENHARVVARALERRGLASDWAMEPLDPIDPRRYRFVSKRDVERQFELQRRAGIRASNDQSIDSGSPAARMFDSSPASGADLETAQRSNGGKAATTRALRVMRHMREVVSWYASPIGIVSALAFLVVLGLLVVGSTEWSIVVVLVWLGAIVPYKLQRERSDRIGQLFDLSRRLDRVKQQTEAGQENSEAAQSRVVGLTPTIRRLSLSGEALDRRVAALETQAAHRDQLGDRSQAKPQAGVAQGEPVMVYPEPDDEIASPKDQALDGDSR